MPVRAPAPESPLWHAHEPIPRIKRIAPDSRIVSRTIVRPYNARADISIAAIDAVERVWVWVRIIRIVRRIVRNVGTIVAGAQAKTKGDDDPSPCVSRRYCAEQQNQGETGNHYRYFQK